MASFEDIMRRPSGEIRPPEAFPVGTYHCIVDGNPEHKTSKNQNEFWQFKFKILSALADVDPKKIAENQVIGKTIIADYYVTEAAAWRLVELLKDHLGIDDEEGQRSSEEMLMEVPGKQLLVKLRQEMSQDNKRVFHRVESTAHV